MDENDDFALALQLQAEFDEELARQVGNCTSGNVAESFNSSMTLVDERWELVDPNPDVRSLFLHFNDRYFWGKLAGVEVKWSPRMTMCAGLCSYEGRGGLCSIRLSTPLLNLRPRKDLIETLLDREGHGPEFCKHMDRINKESGTKISIYHTFHDEVDHYRQHWWRCDGPCRSRKPYFGYVKRAMNRAPHPRDTWWAQHQQTCGGSFTKVKEPESFTKKKEKKDSKQEKGPEKPKKVDILSFWGQGSKSAGSHSKGPSSQSGGPISHSGGPSSSQSGGTVVIPVQSPKEKNMWNDKCQKPALSHTVGKADTDAKESFPGEGYILADLAKSPSNGIITRKIPGIGIIKSERPQGWTQSMQLPQRIDLESPLRMLSCSSPKKVSYSSPSGRRSLPVYPESAFTDTESEEEFEQSLKFRKKIHGMSSLSQKNLKPGQVVRVSGFRSVSSGMVGPRVTAGSNPHSSAGQPTRPSMTYKGSSTSQNHTSKELTVSDSGSDGDDDDDDDDESMTLGSVKRKVNGLLIPPGKRAKVLTPADSSLDEEPAFQAEHPPSTSGVDRCHLGTGSSQEPAVPVEGEWSELHPVHTCPVCQAQVRASLINEHLDQCLS